MTTNTECKGTIDLLFETSWEVCNKVGGIYAVLSTKARTLQAMYGDSVIFIGPDVWTPQSPSPYFTEDASLLHDWRKSAVLPAGVAARVGRWNVPGSPIAILVKFDAMYAHNAELFGKMWELYGVDSLHAYGDYPEACAFSHAAALVIESICRHVGTDGKHIIAHFNEWTTGMGLLHVKATLPQVATVFTTHATSIGRSICGNGKLLYAYFNGYDGDQMAEELNMQSKHSLEKTAAHQADCFTTVSEVTARECEQLLGIRPLVTPNGFEKDFVPTAKAMPAARRKARHALLNLASSLIGEDVAEDAFLVATSGRCEFRNKGIDVYLDSARILADRLRAEGSSRRVIYFVMVPTWAREARHELIAALPCHPKLGRPGDPVITHHLNNPESDPIIGTIHRLGFCNLPSDPLHVIYVPCYLDGFDGLFGGLNYYELLPGLDATVFPSYYEPWGYTPLESVAFGVPTITTSLSGFGQWVNETFPKGFSQSGVHVNERNDDNYSQLCFAIADQIHLMLLMEPEMIHSLRKAASRTADKAAWSHFIKHYAKAFRTALTAARKRNQ
jgi:glycosyltransferase involved in cell wall biosynthesis